MRAASKVGFAALAVSCGLTSCSTSPDSVTGNEADSASATARDGSIAALAGDGSIAAIDDGSIAPSADGAIAVTADGAPSAGDPDAACPTPCAGDMVCCGGVCADLRTGAAHCGSCSTSCNAARMEVCAAGQCGVVDWALWPMPNGQDDTDAGAPNPNTYSDNMDGTVTDRVTHLMWQQVVPTTGGAGNDGNLMWAEATSYCATLVLAGHDDWRLPSQIELVSILDYSNLGAGQPPINRALFPNTPADAFWSSTKSAVMDTSAWTVYMDVGFTYAYDMTTVGRVRCVR